MTTSALPAVVEPYTPGTVELVGELPPLARWAENARLASEIARQLALTPFTPDSLRVKTLDPRGKPIGIDHEATVGNVLGVLLVGDELGLQPMAALRSIDIIKGTPALRAVTLRAIAQAHGHELVLEESTQTRAIVKGRRKGSTEWQRSTWTIDRAKGLGLTGRDQWRNQPTAMLIARATAECARLIASDALLGLPYASEELDDDLAGVEQAQPADAAEASDKPQRTARRRSAKPSAAPAEAQDEPGFDDDAAAPAAEAAPPAEPEPPAPAEPAPAPITQAQLKKLHVVLGENDLASREAGLAFISDFAGHPIASSKELTKDEGTRLIDELERRAAAAKTTTAGWPEDQPGFEDPPLDEPPLDGEPA